MLPLRLQTQVNVRTGHNLHCNHVLELGIIVLHPLQVFLPYHHIQRGVTPAPMHFPLWLFVCCLLYHPMAKNPELFQCIGSWPTSLIQTLEPPEPRPCRISPTSWSLCPPTPKSGIDWTICSVISKYFPPPQASHCQSLRAPSLGIWNIIPLL